MITINTAFYDTAAPKAWAPTGLLATIANRAVAVVYGWQQRASTRHHLMTLDDRMLKDIGLSRADAEREGRKQFWRP